MYTCVVDRHVDDKHESGGQEHASVLRMVAKNTAQDRLYWMARNTQRLVNREIVKRDDNEVCDVCTGSENELRSARRSRLARGAADAGACARVRVHACVRTWGTNRLVCHRGHSVREAKRILSRLRAGMRFGGREGGCASQGQQYSTVTKNKRMKEGARMTPPDIQAVRQTAMHDHARTCFAVNV
jgi:hypothetical protein